VRPTAKSLFRIGVFGAASNWSDEASKRADAIGEAIAKCGMILVTGATSGLPYQAGQAAIKNEGFVLGISPAHNSKDHVERYQKPLDGCSLIIWTGAGYTVRNCLNVLNCDGAIFIGGETGTLEEFCIAHYEGKVIGIAEGTGGVTDQIQSLMKSCPTDHGAVIIYDQDPARLVAQIVDRLQERLMA
jgi:uncharacterized protein (TIGR00725 family)